MFSNVAAELSVLDNYISIHVEGLIRIPVLNRNTPVQVAQTPLRSIARVSFLSIPMTIGRIGQCCKITRQELSGQFYEKDVGQIRHVQTLIL